QAPRAVPPARPPRRFPPIGPLRCRALRPLLVVLVLPARHVAPPMNSHPHSLHLIFVLVGLVLLVSLALLHPIQCFSIASERTRPPSPCCFKFESLGEGGRARERCNWRCTPRLGAAGPGPRLHSALLTRPYRLLRRGCCQRFRQRQSGS